MKEIFHQRSKLIFIVFLGVFLFAIFSFPSFFKISKTDSQATCCWPTVPPKPTSCCWPPLISSTPTPTLIPTPLPTPTLTPTPALTPTMSPTPTIIPSSTPTSLPAPTVTPTSSPPTEPTATPKPEPTTTPTPEEEKKAEEGEKKVVSEEMVAHAIGGVILGMEGIPFLPEKQEYLIEGLYGGFVFGELLGLEAVKALPPTGGETNSIKDNQGSMRLLIPSLVIDLPVKNAEIVGSQWEVLDDAVSFGRDSTLPGEGRVSVLFAHGTNDFFAKLGQVEKEAIVFLSFRGKIYGYQIVGKEVVSPNNLAVLQGEKEGIVLITCFKNNKNFGRITVKAERIL